MERTTRRSDQPDHDVVDVRPRVPPRDQRVRDAQRAVRFVRGERLRRIAPAAGDRAPRRRVDDRAGRVRRAVAAVGAGGEQRDARAVLAGARASTRAAASASSWQRPPPARPRRRRAASSVTVVSPPQTMQSRVRAAARALEQWSRDRFAGARRFAAADASSTTLDVVAASLRARVGRRVDRRRDCCRSRAPTRARTPDASCVGVSGIAPRVTAVR